jgi:solute carrier family 25 carnitine/acylcarnitine transporter 20/29
MEGKPYTFNDFYMGGFSGAIGALLSHPIDTIKSNAQNGKQIKWTVSNLYKGVSAPIVGIGLEKAIVFGTYENTFRYLQKTNTLNEYTNYGLAGSMAGFAASFIVTPVERIKILAQTNNMITMKDLNPRFLFRGLSSTFTRETPGFAIYFTTYNALKSHYSKTTELNVSHYFAFGGLSGAVSWLFIYPQDLVKTKVQSSKLDLKFKDIVKLVYKESGVTGFFKGFHYAMLRAIPLHAGTFATMEILKEKYNT